MVYCSMTSLLWWYHVGGITNQCSGFGAKLLRLESNFTKFVQNWNIAKWYPWNDDNTYAQWHQLASHSQKVPSPPPVQWSHPPLLENSALSPASTTIPPGNPKFTGDQDQENSYYSILIMHGCEKLIGRKLIHLNVVLEKSFADIVDFKNDK